MNWDRIEGSWKQFKDTARQQWRKLTDDPLDAISGKRHAEKRGATWEQAQKAPATESKPLGGK